jgi:two-component system, cell cycle sensor histidine kinase and response regulator CckA
MGTHNHPDVTASEPSEQDPATLLHELQSHQAELEMQNQALQESELEATKLRDRYLELYESAPVPYVTIDRAGTILEANVAARTLLGVERDRLVGANLGSFLGPSDADVLDLCREQLFLHGMRISCALAVQRPDGRTIPVYLEGRAFGDSERGATLYRCVLIDLSEVRLARDSLEKDESLSATILDTADDAMISADVSGLIESCNRAAVRLFGYAEDEILGLNLQVLMPPVPPGESKIGRRKDGSTFHARLDIGEWRDGELRKFIAIIHDITEGEKVEARLVESENRFRQISENIEDVFYIRAPDGVLTYVSPPCERLFGRPAAEILAIKDKWLELIHPDDRDRVARAHEMAAKGDPFDCEYRILRPDGEARWLHDRTFEVESAGGTHGLVGIMQDVTTRHRLEEELRHAQKMEAVGALASGVAHDFNNVLQAIMGLIHFASSDPSASEAVRAILGRAVETVRRGGRLSNQLVAFARKRQLVLRPVNFDDAVRDAARLVERLLTEQVQLEVETRAPTTFILADAADVEQILMNLATNARDAMPEGGTLRIETETVRLAEAEQERYLLPPAETYVRLRVRDTGAGMDESTKEHIFEPFFTTKDIGKGTGLGLSSVFSVTRALSGHVEVESERGKGTTFSFFFPCCRPPVEESNNPREKESVSSGSVLVVEDEAAVRISVRRYLEELGFRVIDAATVAEALQLCEANPELRLVVTDMIMPGMIGPRLAEIIRRRYPGLPVVFMSAQPEVDRGVHFDESTFIQKPFAKDDLAAKIADLFRRRRSAVMKP